jgi:hypothetical protein
MIYSAFCPASLQTNREVARALKKHGFPPKGYGMDWKHNKKFKLTERWAQIWEKFAGRPYVKPKRLKTGVIHETVKESQEILARLNLGQIWRAHREYKEKVLNDVAHVHPVGPPQTLGELCVSICEDKLLAYKVRGDTTDLIRTNIERIGVFGIKETFWFPRRDIQALCRAMYHNRRECPPCLNSWSTGVVGNEKGFGYEIDSCKLHPCKNRGDY